MGVPTVGVGTVDEVSSYSDLSGEGSTVGDFLDNFLDFLPALPVDFIRDLVGFSVGSTAVFFAGFVALLNQKSRSSAPGVSFLPVAAGSSTTSSTSTFACFAFFSFFFFSFLTFFVFSVDGRTVTTVPYIP